jgi:hypothetical protein
VGAGAGGSSKAEAGECECAGNGSSGVRAVPGIFEVGPDGVEFVLTGASGCVERLDQRYVHRHGDAESDDVEG